MKTAKVAGAPAAAASLTESKSFKVSHVLAFLPIFSLLFILGLLKAILIAPVVFLIIFIGNITVMIALYPCHAVWTYYCVLRTRRFGILLKVLIFLVIPPGLVMWPISVIIGTILTGMGYGTVMPLLATFEAVREGVEDKLFRCFVDGTLSSVKGALTIVRDFKDTCYYSYFSFMDELLAARGETLLDVRFAQVPGCALACLLGLFIDVPMISLIVLCKVPIMLYKGWKQLIKDLIGRSGPFLESVCVPFAGFLILLWPAATGVAAVAGILSSFPLGCYAAVIAYQENSTKCGILYVISVLSEFDEFTNDFLYLREGSCLPRPPYGRQVLARAPSFVTETAPEPPNTTRPVIKTASMKMKELKAVQIWDNFFKSCEMIGKELVRSGAIQISDLEAWQSSKNKIVIIGLPSYAFLLCFLRSIKSGSSGFVLRDNLEMTTVNRPEGRIFDWLFEPMTVIKEQIRAANLEPSEEAYLYKLTLCCGDATRLATWQNGGIPPADEVKRAQLEGISRRLQGFSLSLSRIPTFRRRFEEVVKALLKEEKQGSVDHNGNGSEQAQYPV